MDDSQTLDDLAALFLSPPGGGAPPAALAGPAPVRLRPKPSGSAPAASAPGPGLKPTPADATHPRGDAGARGGDPGGAPAGGPRLRLAGDQGPPPKPAAPTRPAVEAVVLGNLPGLADAWLPQYAQLLALRDGPVLLLHPVGPADPDDPLGLAGGGDGGGGGDGDGGPGFELEWIGPGGPEAASLLASLPADASFRGRVSALVSRSRNPPATLLVHAAAEGPEAAARFAGVRDWALLSGNDPVAVQGAAAALRRLVAAAPSLASASVGLMVMGAGPAAAAPAAEALDEALGGAAGPLELPVEALGALPRMNPVTRTPLGFAPEPEGPEAEPSEGWAALLSWVRSLPPVAAAEAEPEPEPWEPAPPPRAEAPAPVPAAPATASAGPGPGLRLAGGPDAGALATRLAGALPAGPRLDPIGPGCPDQPGVQLALDGGGRLHLLARHTHSAEHPHPREAMLALRDAADWAREHQHWLAAAHPHRRVDATEPVPHLLTDRPDLGLSLAKKLGPALRLYLLHGDVCYALTEGA